MSFIIALENILLLLFSIVLGIWDLISHLILGIIFISCLVNLCLRIKLLSVTIYCVGANLVLVFSIFGGLWTTLWQNISKIMMILDVLLSR